MFKTKYEFLFHLFCCKQKITNEKNLVKLIIVSILFIGCSKETTDKELANNPIAEKAKKIKQTNLKSRSSSSTTSLLGWEQDAINFFNYTENGITQNIPTNQLQALGNMLDRGSFDSASQIYNIPVQSLVQLRDMYYTSYTNYYYEVYSPSSSRESQIIASNGISSKKGGVTPNYIPPEGGCEEYFLLCNSDARDTYLLNMASCYGGAIALGAGATPIGGGLFLIGCGLIAGRKHTNDRSRCQLDFNNCH